MDKSMSKNVYSAGKTSGVQKDDVSGANRCYVLAHWDACLVKVNINIVHQSVILSKIKDSH